PETGSRIVRLSEKTAAVVRPAGTAGKEASLAPGCHLTLGGYHQTVLDNATLAQIQTEILTEKPAAARLGIGRQALRWLQHRGRNTKALAQRLKALLATTADALQGIRAVVLAGMRRAAAWARTTLGAKAFRPGAWLRQLRGQLLAAVPAVFMETAFAGQASRQEGRQYNPVVAVLFAAGLALPALVGLFYGIFSAQPLPQELTAGIWILLAPSITFAGAALLAAMARAPGRKAGPFDQSRFLSTAVPDEHVFFFAAEGGLLKVNPRVKNALTWLPVPLQNAFLYSLGIAGHELRHLGGDRREGRAYFATQILPAVLGAVLFGGAALLAGLTTAWIVLPAVAGAMLLTFLAGVFQSRQHLFMDVRTLPEFRQILQKDTARAGHILRVIHCFERLLANDLDYFTDRLPGAGQLPAEVRRQYQENLRNLRAQYLRLPYAQQQALRWELILHDIGYATGEELGHEARGAQLARQIMQARGVAPEVVRLATAEISTHMRLGWAIQGELRAAKFQEQTEGLPVILLQIQNTMDVMGVDPQTNRLAPEDLQGLVEIGRRMRKIAADSAHYRIMRLGRRQVSAPDLTAGESARLFGMVENIFGPEYRRYLDVFDRQIDFVSGVGFLTSALAEQDQTYRQYAKFLKLMVLLVSLSGQAEVNFGCDVGSLFKRMTRQEAVRFAGANISQALDQLPDDFTLEELRAWLPQQSWIDARPGPEQAGLIFFKVMAMQEAPVLQAGALATGDALVSYDSIKATLAKAGPAQVVAALAHADPLVRGQAAARLAGEAVKRREPVMAGRMIDALQTRLQQETDWIAAQAMQNTLLLLGGALPAQIPVLDHWQPRQTQQVTTVLQDFIDKLKQDGYESNLRRIISWSNSYTRNTWMIGHDLDEMKILHQGIPADKEAEYRRWLQDRFLRIGVKHLDPRELLSAGDGQADLNTKDRRGQPLYQVVYEPGAGFQFHEALPLGYRHPKHEVRTRLFSQWEEGSLAPQEKSLLQRVHAFPVARRLFGLDRFFISAGEEALLAGLQAKGLIKIIFQKKTITAVLASWRNTEGPVSLEQVRQAGTTVSSQAPGLEQEKVEYFQSQETEAEGIPYQGTAAPQWVTVENVRAPGGKIRLQLFRATPGQDKTTLVYVSPEKAEGVMRQIELVFELLPDHLRSVETNVLRNREQGIAHSLALWRLRLAQRLYPDNPHPLEMDLVINPVVLHLAEDVFLPDTIQVFNHRDSQWHSLREPGFDVYQAAGKVWVQGKQQPIIIERQQSGEYKVTQVPEGYAAEMDGVKLTVREAGTGKRIADLDFTTNIRIRGRPRPAASAAPESGPAFTALKPAGMPSGTGGTAYAGASILGEEQAYTAPLWEEPMFRGLAFGLPALMGKLSLKALFSLGWQSVSAMLGWSIVVFAGAHIVVRWIKRAKEAIGWQALLPWKFLQKQYRQRQDLKDFFKYLIPAMLFTGMYIGALALGAWLSPEASQWSLHGIALLAGFVGHEAWNYAVKKGWLPGMLVADLDFFGGPMPAVGSRATPEKKKQLFLWLETAFAPFGEHLKDLTKPGAAGLIRKHLSRVTRLAEKIDGQDQTTLAGLLAELERAVLKLQAVIVSGQEEAQAGAKIESEIELGDIIDRLDREYFVPNGFLLEERYPDDRGVQLVMYHIDAVHHREVRALDWTGKQTKDLMPVYVATRLNEPVDPQDQPMYLAETYLVLEGDYLRLAQESLTQFPSKPLEADFYDDAAFVKRLNSMKKVVELGIYPKNTLNVLNVYRRLLLRLFLPLDQHYQLEAMRASQALSRQEREAIVVDLGLLDLQDEAALYAVEQLLARTAAEFQDQRRTPQDRQNSLRKARIFLLMFFRKMMLGAPWISMGLEPQHVAVLSHWLETAGLADLAGQIRSLQPGLTEDAKPEQEKMLLLTDAYQRLWAFLSGQNLGAAVLPEKPGDLPPVARHEEAREFLEEKGGAIHAYVLAAAALDLAASSQNPGERALALKETYEDAWAEILSGSISGAHALNFAQRILARLYQEETALINSMVPEALAALRQVLDQAPAHEKPMLSSAVQELLQEALFKVTKDSVGDQISNFIIEQRFHFGGLWPLTRERMVAWLTQKRGFAQRTAERSYDFGLAFIVENKLALAAGAVIMGAIGLGVALWTGSFDFLLANGIQWGWILSWGAVFLPMHFVTRKGWRLPARGALIPSVIITIINILLAFTPLPWWGLMLAGMGVHEGTNLIAALAGRRRGGARQKTPGPEQQAGLAREKMAQQIQATAEDRKGMLDYLAALSPQDQARCLEGKGAELEKIRQGGFNVRDPAHKFLGYELLREEAAGQDTFGLEITFKDYMQWLQTQRNQFGYAGKEKAEMIFLAYEAWRLKQFVMQLKAVADQQGRPLVVIENLTYGRVAAMAIEKELQEQGVEIIRAKAGSSYAHDHPAAMHGVHPETDDAKLLSTADLKRILERDAMVVVVDGTYSLDPDKRPPVQDNAHFSDSQQIWRNLGMALSQNPRDEDFGIQGLASAKDQATVRQALETSPLYQEVRKKADEIKAGRGNYKMFFWHPGSMVMDLRSEGNLRAVPGSMNLSNPSHPEQALVGKMGNDPAWVFAVANMENEAIPEKIRALARTAGEEYHNSGYLDDNGVLARLAIQLTPRGPSLAAFFETVQAGYEMVKATMEGETKERKKVKASTTASILGEEQAYSAPLWEEPIFRGLTFGLPALMKGLSVKALFSLGWQSVSAMLGWSIVVFAGAHIVVRWIKRAKEAIGWKALLPWKFLQKKYMQRKDFADFFKYLIPAILFTGMYIGALALGAWLSPDASQWALQGIALLAGMLAHEVWNIFTKRILRSQWFNKRFPRLATFLGKYMLVAAMRGEESKKAYGWRQPAKKSLTPLQPQGVKPSEVDLFTWVSGILFSGFFAVFVLVGSIPGVLPSLLGLLGMFGSVYFSMTLVRYWRLGKALRDTMLDPLLEEYWQTEYPTLHTSFTDLKKDRQAYLTWFKAIPRKVRKNLKRKAGMQPISWPKGQVDPVIWERLRREQPAAAARLAAIKSSKNLARGMLSVLPGMPFRGDIAGLVLKQFQPIDPAVKEVTFSKQGDAETVELSYQDPRQGSKTIAPQDALYREMRDKRNVLQEFFRSGYRVDYISRIAWEPEGMSIRFGLEEKYGVRLVNRQGNLEVLWEGPMILPWLGGKAWPKFSRDLGKALMSSTGKIWRQPSSQPMMFRFGIGIANFIMGFFWMEFVYNNLFKGTIKKRAQHALQAGQTITLEDLVKDYRYYWTLQTPYRAIIHRVLEKLAASQPLIRRTVLPDGRIEYYLQDIPKVRGERELLDQIDTAFLPQALEIVNSWDDQEQLRLTQALLERFSRPRQTPAPDITKGTQKDPGQFERRQQARDAHVLGMVLESLSSQQAAKCLPGFLTAYQSILQSHPSQRARTDKWLQQLWNHTDIFELAETGAIKQVLASLAGMGEARWRTEAFRACRRFILQSVSPENRRWADNLIKARILEEHDDGVLAAIGEVQRTIDLETPMRLRNILVLTAYRLLDGILGPYRSLQKFLALLQERYSQLGVWPVLKSIVNKLRNAEKAKSDYNGKALLANLRSKKATNTVPLSAEKIQWMEELAKVILSRQWHDEAERDMLIHELQRLDYSNPYDWIAKTYLFQESAEEQQVGKYLLRICLDGVKKDLAATDTKQIKLQGPTASIFGEKGIVPYVAPLWEEP
ncbi:hypothetical protein JW933_05425, partial [candidate division FCPU426 bacterium]|nr:hypothetical protein [candidate division FCPU426 bacterium]